MVNLYGQAADMDEILSICSEHNVPVIEDAAESLGATYKGKQTGILGKFGIFSFNGNKIITTSGGGMLVSDDIDAIKKARFWATQSRDQARHYQHSELGFNYRMSNICAGIGRGQLLTIDKKIAKKKEVYESYKNKLAELKMVEFNPVCDYGEPNYWLSCMLINKESAVKPVDVILALEKENIESRPIWKPMQLQPFFEKYEFFNHNARGVSVSEDIFNRGLCLPSDVNMTDADLDRVVKIVTNTFQADHF
ncbi:putative pyridoxal phosphate-dependent aminotransferase EpsN [bioreactor metagenome]|uniref:Putative pyridoxal phosphate-dependent aminotransferase EpsN n=1 Tax=bioreactor metagenome TaxID=1076179 RepID=A0A645EJD5_9ZZZZ